MSENHTIEYKRIWKDDYLKWICAFANAQGGTLFVGIDDDGAVVGVENPHQLLETLPNKIVNHLGIYAEVSKEVREGRTIVRIGVHASCMPISYRGAYYVRSGATVQELKGMELQDFLLRRWDTSWDALPHGTATLDDIDRGAIDFFLAHAIDSGRLDASLKMESTPRVLANLHLLEKDGIHLRHAAILLFGKEPLQYFPGVEFRLCRIGVSNVEIMFQDTVEGNIMQMANRIIQLLKSKYLISYIHFEGLQRKEVLEIPEEALRELIFNAIVHKQYPGVHIQMKVYNDRIELWNNGLLPTGTTIETLSANHMSYVRNKQIANAFYKAGFIESWGLGIEKVQRAFVEAGLQPPRYDTMQGGVLVTIPRPPMKLSPTDESRVKNEKGREKPAESRVKNEKSRVIILEYLREHPSATQKELAQHVGISTKGIEKQLSTLKANGLIERVGSARKGFWNVLSGVQSL